MVTPRVVRLIVAGIAALGVGQPAWAELVTITSSRDNTLYQDTLGAKSNGAGPYVFAGKNNSGMLRHGVIAFDLAGNVPAGATITSVRLSLAMTEAALNETLPRMMGLHRLATDWGEGTSDSGTGSGAGSGVKSTPGDATWLHTFYNTGFWTNPGGDFAETASATTEVGFNPGVYTWESTAALVADAQGWLAAPATNFGWLILGDESTGGTIRRFGSHENGTVGNRPTLAIEFTPDRVPGDVDLDYDVDIFDVAVLQTKYGAESGAGWRDGDFDGNGTVDIFDVAKMQTNYGQGVAAANPVPEPSTLVLGLLAATVCVLWLRRKEPRITAAW
ncbi:MAG: DNRLRE domain-containing protein [Pirellulales bacterium]